MAFAHPVAASGPRAKRSGKELNAMSSNWSRLPRLWMIAATMA